MKPALIVCAILALMNIYAALSLRLKLPVGTWITLLIGLAFLLFFGLQLVAPLLDWSMAPLQHRLSGDFYDSTVRASYLALGVLSCLLVFSAASDVLMLGSHFFVRSESARQLVGSVLLGAVLIALAGTLGSGLYQAGKLEVVRVDLPLKSLPPALDGLTIAQISDVHVGVHLRHAFVQDIVDRVMALHPDMVVLTGDVADGLAERLEPEVTPLASLSPVYGKYYITGNHEYYWGVQSWMTLLGKQGFKVLTNEHIVIEKDGAKLLIAGVPDLASLREGASQATNPERALLGAPDGAVKILLSHQPRVFAAAQKAGFDAQLSGHTHAGQYFPFTWIIKLIEAHPHGLYDIEGFKLYVNKGAGFWGPPLRTGGFGEITLLTLRRR